jgi:hypothetical protein
MISRELAPHPLVVLRLCGTQAEMGEQHARLLAPLGGYGGILRFYPKMAARLLSSGVPHDARAAFEAVAGVVLDGLSRRMHHHRRRLFPALAARTEALLAAAGVPASLAPSLLTMDVFQNAVGILGRVGVIPSHTFSASALSACSSLAVWGKASADGTLRHARNFDFPGAGVWDHAPAVVFCEPDEGLRYGFVTTRGADVPGVTAFNEAGLTVTFHTRLHRDVRFDGPAVVDLGHEIVRRARPLADAVELSRRLGSASTWAILVSSAAEACAVLIETTGREVVALSPAEGAHHLACTNRYQARSLAAGEITTSRAFVVDSEARRARLDERVRKAPAGLSGDDLEDLLGDLAAVNACDRGDATTRLAGDCIVSPITVQSIVNEPEQRRLRVSVGRAPTGFGPFAVVPWAWDGAVGVAELPPPDRAPRARDHRGRPLDAEARATVRTYVEVSRLHLERAEPKAVRALTELLVERAPGEPHYRALAAFAAVGAGDFARAAEHLDAALAVEAGEQRRARLLLHQSRVLHVLGRAAEATAARRELLAMSGAVSLPERHAARGEAERPIPARRLRRLVPDYHLIDAAVPGASV